MTVAGCARGDARTAGEWSRPMDVSQEVKLINSDEMTDEGKGSRGLQHGANGVDGHHNQSINDTVTCDSL